MTTSVNINEHMYNTVRSCLCIFLSLSGRDGSGKRSCNLRACIVSCVPTPLSDGRPSSCIKAEARDSNNCVCAKKLHAFAAGSLCIVIYNDECPICTSVRIQDLCRATENVFYAKHYDAVASMEVTTPCDAARHCCALSCYPPDAMSPMRTPNGDTVPAGHRTALLHSPSHANVCSPSLDPYTPAGHTACCADVLPGGQ
jgi:hypothetical protein